MAGAERRLKLLRALRRSTHRYNGLRALGMTVSIGCLFAVPLSGLVAWYRPKAEQGRQPGMGIQLDHAPPMYNRYVDRLREEQANETS